MIRTFQFFAVIAICTSLSCVSRNQGTDNPLCSFVDPFIGTGGHGHTYPGCSAPFGMMQLSPDTRLDGWDGCSGYHYSDSLLYGFSHTHLSGTGVADYCDVLLMPFNRNVQYNAAVNSNSTYPAFFDKASESASPGYYAVTLRDLNINVELTCLQRSGIHKYVFPDREASVMVDLVHRDKVIDAKIHRVDDFTITGYRISSSWAKEQHLYFAIEFSSPIKKMEIVQVENESAQLLNTAQGKYIKSGLYFDLDSDNTLEIKIAISAVSEAGALLNLRSELQDLNFEATREIAESTWEEQLSKVKIDSDSRDVMVNFYTALYHVYLSPDLYADADGQYRGTDLNIHRSDKHKQYTVFSLWDTYRAAHPLYAILNRKESADFAYSFLSHYKTGGSLPVWELAANYTGCMIGYHSVPVLYDAYNKGIISDETETALAAMLSIAEKDELGKSNYIANGYIGARDESESVSKTLEYAYDDWCIAQFAKSLADYNIAEKYSKRAQSYKNVFDPQTRFMRARVNGGWFEPFKPEEVNFNYTEANAWQYNFYVPHDIYSLIDLYEGASKFEDMLDSLFSVNSETSGREQADITGMIGQYAHGNEPSHHMAYLYNYVNHPSKTQKYVRQIMKDLYMPVPDGLSGNEDCGQMSAWYIFSALGFYPVNPASNIYAIGSPEINSAILSLENGNTFTVRAKNNSEKNIYVQKLTWNGEEYSKKYITYEMIMEGGTLEFAMGSAPASFFDTEIIPASRIETNLIVPVPYVTSSARTFTNKHVVQLEHLNKNAGIQYVINKGPFENYNRPVEITENTTLSFRAIVGDDTSKTVTANYTKMKSGRSIKLSAAYASQYSAGGDDALIDGLKGTDDFRTGDWQGYQGTDLSAIIDLGKTEFVKNISVGCLQDWNSWIFMPEKIVLLVSDDGLKFVPVSHVVNTIDAKEEGCIIQNMLLPCGRNAKFIRVDITGLKKNPEWHRAPGDPCWIFIDEILIN